MYLCRPPTPLTTVEESETELLCSAEGRPPNSESPTFSLCRSNLDDTTARRQFIWEGTPTVTLLLWYAAESFRSNEPI
jgi:hypothetical protein